MKCNACNGNGVILSCDMRKGSGCNDKSCGDCNGTGKILADK